MDVQQPALEAVLADQDLPAFRTVLGSLSQTVLTWIWMRSSTLGSVTYWTGFGRPNDASRPKPVQIGRSALARRAQ
jgi:hypothetical protein